VRSGKLKIDVAILAPPNPATPVNEHGEPTAAYTTEATVYGEIVGETADTVWVDDQRKTIRVVQLRLRYYSTVTEKYRVSFNSRTFDIEGVHHDYPRLTETILDLIERVA
jgi:head-tail adaptor